MGELIAAGGCWNANRFALDEAGGATRNWVAAIEADATMATNQQLILAANFDGDDMNVATGATFKLQWRDVTDAGAWTDLASTGEMKWGTSSLQMTNGTTLVSAEYSGGNSVNCTAKGWSVEAGESHEVVGENQQTNDVQDDEIYELQWLVDLADADSAHIYEFRIVDTSNSVIGTGLGQLTVGTPGRIDLVTRNEDRSAVEVSVKVSAFLSDEATPPNPIGEPVTSGTSNATTGVLALTTNIFSGSKYILVGSKGTAGTAQSDATPEVTAVAL